MSKIGIIGAMEEEVHTLKNEMNIKEIKTIANVDFYTGTIGTKKVVLARCGVGKVNAAICTQILISVLGVDTIINVGVAGALRDDLNVLDVVVSTDVQQHDFDVTGFGYKLGEIPGIEKSVFPANEILIERALYASKKAVTGNKIIKGRIISGDIFVNDIKLKQNLSRDFNACCTEMEGAAIGHVCFMNDIPFVIIRTISDRADGEAHSNFNVFVQQAANYSKDIVTAMLNETGN